MVHISLIEARLSKLGIRLSRWFKPELRELQHTLMDNEEIVVAVPGRYFGGYALLVATDQRLLMIDKRAFFMSLEDIRYDMISEVDFNSRLLESSIEIFSVNKQHRFNSIKYRHHLRKLTGYVQRRVMEIRQHQVDQLTGQPARPAAPAGGSWPTPGDRTPVGFAAGTASPRHTARLVGAAAMESARRLNHNPYANAPLMMRQTIFGSADEF